MDKSALGDFDMDHCPLIGNDSSDNKVHYSRKSLLDSSCTVLSGPHTRIRGYYRKAVNRFGHATPVHIHAMFASANIKLKSI